MFHRVIFGEKKPKTIWEWFEIIKIDKDVERKFVFLEDEAQAFWEEFARDEEEDKVIQELKLSNWQQKECFDHMMEAVAQLSYDKLMEEVSTSVKGKDKYFFSFRLWSATKCVFSFFIPSSTFGLVNCANFTLYGPMRY